MKNTLIPLSLLGSLVFSTTGHAEDAAKFISQSVPVTMEAGVRYPISITLKNTGTTTWTETDLFRLNARFPSGQSELGTMQWGTNRAFLSAGERVAPGELKTFTFTITAPNAYSYSDTDHARAFRGYDFQWGMVHDGVSEFGEPSPIVEIGVVKSPNLTASGIYAPKKAPVAVSAADFGNNFRGANILKHRYAASPACTHTEWIPDTEMDTLADQAVDMGLKYLRLPVVIPPAVPGNSLPANGCPGGSEWQWATPNSDTNIARVTKRVQAVLASAQRHGLKVLIILDGYTKLKQSDGQCYWKHSYEEVESNARTLIQAISADPALLGWDVLNEPMWVAKASGCLNSDSDHASVVNAVHAMYNLIRDNDPYNHPTTVGEGASPYYKYWRDIVSFASPHIYLPARQKSTIDTTVLKTDIDQVNYTQTAMLRQIEAAFPGVPMIIGETGLQLDTTSGTAVTAPLTETSQANYYERFLNGMTIANHGYLFWALSTSPYQQDISILREDGSARPAVDVVARQAWYPIVQQLYIAYTGRPADPVGLQNFASGLLSVARTNKLPTSLTAIEGFYNSSLQLRTLIDSLGNSAESRAFYNYNDTTALVSGIYNTAFKRAPAQAGLDYWVSAINSGTLEKSRAAFSIIAAASANTSAQAVTDTATLQKKGAVAGNFTASLNTAEWTSCYVGPTSNAAGRSLLIPVTSTTDVQAYQPTIDGTLVLLANGLRSEQPKLGKAPCQ
ncbi:cellulase family glycosylhydrolase [Rugamonas sp. FT82W]|uniref:Cellulase family glycosylhydrolase n=1 Tax=Duganella vulcania TaxID=2692166 RepID=A0A845G3E3_9BURK|nr:cellulase family glycosylhydrolase [Duganella vulcania]MYM87556.1 cellulase family glycosylhydrolase [Duganella vulcania]